jgi:hypothetical protein
MTHYTGEYQRLSVPKIHANWNGRHFCISSSPFCAELYELVVGTETAMSPIEKPMHQVVPDATKLIT